MEFYGVPHAFHSGDITCIPKNIPHTTYSNKNDPSLWSYIFFNPNDMIKQVIQSPGHFMDSSFANSNYFFQVNKDENPYMHTLVLSIIREMTEQKSHYKDSTKGLLLAFSVELIRYQEQAIKDKAIHKDSESPIREAANNANTNVLAPALDYIEQHYMQQFSIDDLAIMCHLSETHFRRLFSSCIGSSPIDFITYTRIMAACNLLRSTQDSILEISEAIGFRSVSSFNRSFQKIMNQTPREYRNEMIERDNKLAKQSIIEYTGWL